MIFPLELWANVFPESLGPKCREYVDRIHERYVSQTSPPQLLRSDDNTRPAYKRVRVPVDSFGPLHGPDTPSFSILCQSIEKGGKYDLL